MIRVRYSNDEWKEYRTAAIAKFMILNELYASKGKITPVEAVEVFGVTTGGVSVEQPLTIRYGGMVSFDEIP